MIQKQFQTKGDWMRFKMVDKILIDNSTPIKSERQLAYYIYRHHGEGRYMLSAWQKGYKGFWIYWLGFVYDNGFIREPSKNKEIAKLKEEFQKAKSFEEKQDIEEDITFERELAQETKSLGRRGPLGLIKCRPNVMHGYEEF